MSSPSLTDDVASLEDRRVLSSCALAVSSSAYSCKQETLQEQQAGSAAHDMNRLAGLTRAPFRRVTHCIFDLDGTLLDSEDLYAEAVQTIARRYGKTFDWATRSRVMGLTGEERSKKLVELLDLPLTWEEYYDLAKEQHKILMLRAKLMPDTEGSYTMVLASMVGEFGKTYSRELQMKVMGAPDVAGTRTVVEELELPTTTSEFLYEFRRRSTDVLLKCDLMPGAERLVRHLHKHNIPIAIATSSTRESYELKTAIHSEFFSLFHHAVTGGSDEEVKQGKPAPDIFLVAASRFDDKPNPHDCLVFEDAPNGVQGAVTAGMQVVMIPDELVKPELCKLATLKLKSLEEMKPELFGLPSLNEE